MTLAVALCPTGGPYVVVYKDIDPYLLKSKH